MGLLLETEIEVTRDMQENTAKIRLTTKAWGKTASSYEHNGDLCAYLNLYGYKTVDGCTCNYLLDEALPVLAHDDEEEPQAPGTVIEQRNVTVKDFDKFLIQELTEFDGGEEKLTK